MRYAAILALVLLAGCGDDRAKRDQEIANSAATIWEAAEAQKNGVPVEQTAPAIQSNASAIATAVGAPYPKPPIPPEKMP